MFGGSSEYTAFGFCPCLLVLYKGYSKVIAGFQFGEDIWPGSHVQTLIFKARFEFSFTGSSDIPKNNPQKLINEIDVLC